MRVPPAPKAMAIAASPPGHFVRGGATAAEAGAAALAECLAAPVEGGGPPRCRVHAVDDRVVLPQRQPRPTNAASRPPTASAR